MALTHSDTEYEARLAGYRALIAAGRFAEAGAVWRELRRLLRSGELSVVSHDAVLWPSGSEEFRRGLAEFERRFSGQRKPTEKQRRLPREGSFRVG